MDLKIPPEEMTKLVTGAIMQMLTPEKREEMIKEAIAQLLEPQEDRVHSFGAKRRSKMQEAFGDAAQYVARQIFQEELDKPEQKAKLAALVVAALDKALLDTALPERLATVISDSLSGRGR